MRLRPLRLHLSTSAGILKPVPTVLRIGPYRFFFYSNEGAEQPHIHVQREARIAKFWLQPASLAASGSISPTELRAIGRIVEERQNEFLEAWNDFFRS